ncbi:OmpA family protein [Dechloromonas denitrificans]|uniref:OmpA family protein n=1 Tax=Dechloromonas denitrificans TaxID=281362 RepID=UPI001CF91001|nr:OmpA family protein [Dechloromonas denitrificans]UCV13083.1 OmpA family protein [Dechloromonas denitrificans]
MNKILVPMCLVSLLLAACTSERVVLLPSADGRPSAVVVRDAKGELLLNEPYAGTYRRGGSNDSYRSTPEEVQERFGAALAAQPIRPSSYLLYFQQGGNVLTPESQADFVRVRQEIAERPAVEVMVIGHTDRVGSLQANDSLSAKRAEAVRGMLIEAGVPAEKLEAIGRGERDPLVATEDEVAEAKNRRVEISVR